MKQITITFKSNLSTSTISHWLNEMAVERIDILGESEKNSLDWTIGKAK
jgi:hypothetical protein